MSKSLTYILVIAVVGGFAILHPAARAEQGTASAVASWQGEGQLFQIGPEQVMFVGSFNGIMYVQTGEDSMDGFYYALLSKH